MYDILSVIRITYNTVNSNDYNEGSIALNPTLLIILIGITIIGHL